LAHIFSWSQNCSPFGFHSCHHLGIIHKLWRFWLVLNQANCLVPCKAGPQGTSTHQCIIHWMHIITQLWMNLNWVDIWFNQFCKK
jgi:hypothetical protein